MNAGFSYYDILGIQQSATADDIKVAYRAAVLKYHPDVNAAPNAQRLTEIINEAYEILSDPNKRHSYDTSLRAGTAYAEPEQTAEVWELYLCDSCGKIDPHLRYALFYRVWSIIFYTQMRGSGGVLCPQCRSKFAINTALFSALLGPWGFPWGIIYTLRSLFASIRGGEFPKPQNGQLLRHQAMAFYQRGWINDARTTLSASLTFEQNDAVVRLLGDPAFVGSEEKKAPSWLPGQTLATAFLALPFIVIWLLGAWIGSGQTARGTTESPPTNQQQTAQVAQLKDIINQCGDADNPKTDAKRGYDACKRAIVWLNDDIKASTPGSEDLQGYSLLRAEARLKAGLAATRLGRGTESKQLTDDGVTGLKTLMQPGVTADIQNKAKASYNCYVNNQCGTDSSNNAVAASPTSAAPAAPPTSAATPVINVDQKVLAMEDAAMTAGGACIKDNGHDTPDAQQISDCGKAIDATKEIEAQQKVAKATQRDLDAVSLMIGLELFGRGSAESHQGSTAQARSDLTEARSRAQSIVANSLLDQQDLQVAKTLIHAIDSSGNGT
jgi:curved DNA-binding protein CbpA